MEKVCQRLKYLYIRKVLIEMKGAAMTSELRSCCQSWFRVCEQSIVCEAVLLLSLSTISCHHDHAPQSNIMVQHNYQDPPSAANTISVL